MNFMDTQEILPDEEEPTEALQMAPVGPYWLLQMEARDTITLFQSLRVHLQYLSQQPDPPTDSLATVVQLMKILRPAAAEAAAWFQASQSVAPTAD